ncbi:MAG TPA: hypothetical protein PLJ62_10150, partial [Thermoflexales bacterium]|nr:hypothetical protein [Thermoflexales bacterium]
MSDLSDRRERKHALSHKFAEWPKKISGTINVGVDFARDSSRTLFLLLQNLAQRHTRNDRFALAPLYPKLTLV